MTRSPKVICEKYKALGNLNNEVAAEDETSRSSAVQVPHKHLQFPSSWLGYISHLPFLHFVDWFPFYQIGIQMLETWTTFYLHPWMIYGLHYTDFHETSNVSKTLRGDVHLLISKQVGQEIWGSRRPTPDCIKTPKNGLTSGIRTRSDGRTNGCDPHISHSIVLCK
jgi:hypothetical protein